MEKLPKRLHEVPNWTLPKEMRHAVIQKIDELVEAVNRLQQAQFDLPEDIVLDGAPSIKLDDSLSDDVPHAHLLRAAGYETTTALRSALAGGTFHATGIGPARLADIERHLGLIVIR